MEKILVLFSSPHKQGKTAALLNLYLQQYKKQIHDETTVNIISIYDQHLIPCTGCDICFKGGVCPKNIKDNAGNIYNNIIKANHVVVASPIYFSGFPAPLKILIDRSEQFYAKKLQDGKIKNMKTKTGALVATCGSSCKDNFVYIQKCCKQFFDCFDICLSDKLYASNTDSINKIKIFDEN